MTDCAFLYGHTSTTCIFAQVASLLVVHVLPDSTHQCHAIRNWPVLVHGAFIVTPVLWSLAGYVYQ